MNALKIELKFNMEYEGLVQKPKFYLHLPLEFFYNRCVIDILTIGRSFVA